VARRSNAAASSVAEEPAAADSGKRDRRRRGGFRRRRSLEWDGGAELPDGGLVAADEDGEIIQITPGAVAENLRYLLARMMSGTPTLPRSVAFTSTLSGEGVTTLANSFGSVLAHATGQRVCVVDVNWWSFDRRSYRADDDLYGVYEVVWTGKPIETVIMSTQHPGLWYLPAGAAPAARRPMIARSPSLADLVDDLREVFDCVILDVPAVLLTSDALALCTLGDEVVLVVQQGMASRAQIQSVLDDLTSHRLAGVVLNKTESAIPRRLRRLIGL
jgi:Mrp family chromosome partitioning ATPase